MKRRILVKSAAALLAFGMLSVSSVGVLNIDEIQNVSIASDASTKYDPMGLIQKGDGFELSLDQFKVLTGYTGDHKDLAGFGVKSVSIKEVKITDESDALDDAKSNAIDGGKKLALFVEKNDGNKEIFIMLSETKSGDKPARITEVKDKDGNISYGVSTVKAKLGEEEEKEYPGGIKISLGNTVTVTEAEYPIEVKIGFRAEGADTAEVKDNKIVLSGNKKLEVKFPPTETPQETPAEQKVYKVPVKLMKPDKEELARGASSIVTNAIVVEKEGKSEIYIDTVPQENNGEYAFIIKMNVYETDLNSAKAEAELHQTAKYIDSEDSGKENPEGIIKPKTYLIKRNSVQEKQIFVEVLSDVNDIFDTQARLVFDYDKKVEAKNDDIPKKVTVVMTKKKKPVDDPAKKPSTTSSKPAAKTTTTTPAKTGTKLPQTGNPINTAVLITLGIISVAAGTFIYKKK